MHKCILYSHACHFCFLVANHLIIIQNFTRVHSPADRLRARRPRPRRWSRTGTEQIVIEVQYQSWKPFFSPNMQMEDGTCVICWEPIESQSFECPCGARYHETCWNEWNKHRYPEMCTLCTRVRPTTRCRCSTLIPLIIVSVLFIGIPFGLAVTS